MLLAIKVVREVPCFVSAEIDVLIHIDWERVDVAMGGRPSAKDGSIPKRTTKEELKAATALDLSSFLVQTGEVILAAITKQKRKLRGY